MVFRLGFVLISGRLLAPLFWSCRGESAQTQVTQAQYDGPWGLSVNREERLGFLNGIADCRAFHLGQRLSANRSAVEDEQLLANFYQKNPSLLTKPVLQALEQFDSTEGEGRPSGGQGWSHVPHAYWDGLWWKGSSRSERLGFVEGYISCLKERPGRPPTVFSKPPGEYVRRISEWYKLDDATHSIDPVREEEKIANVLLRFADKQGASP